MVRLYGLKKFYVLRPILAVKWIECGYGVVPMELVKIVNNVVGNKRLKRAIENLVKRKKAGGELKRGKKIPSLANTLQKRLINMNQCKLNMKYQD